MGGANDSVLHKSSKYKLLSGCGNIMGVVVGMTFAPCLVVWGVSNTLYMPEDSTPSTDCGVNWSNRFGWSRMFLW